MKQRILHLIGSNLVGGPEKQILNHAFSMQDSPYQIEIGSFHDLAEWPEILRVAEERNIPTVCLRGGPRPDLIPELVAILQARKGVLLCTHGFKANVVGYIAARITNTRHVAFLRGYTAETARVRLYEAMDRFVLRRVAHVICVSRKQAEQVSKMRQGRSQPMVVLNAMLPPWARPDDVEPVTRERLEIPANAFVFGSVGRLSAEKGHRFMLSAFRKAHAALGSARPLHLIVVGDGREQEALERQARDYGLLNKIHFAGFQGNPERWLKLFDCLVQPSLTEGTPNAILEAICLGVPVVASEVGGVPDLITHEDNGLLVPPKDVNALAAAMQRMARDPDLCHRLAAAAQQGGRVYAPAVQKEKLLSVYDTVFASGNTLDNTAAKALRCIRPSAGHPPADI